MMTPPMFGLFLLLDSTGISGDGACWAGHGMVAECAKEYKGNKNKMNACQRRKFFCRHLPVR